MKMKIGINNADELQNLIDTAKKQTTDLEETLNKINDFTIEYTIAN